ncbi:MAG: ComF family protein [Candidatus Stahlbacteria bacterium]|nr:ComF family protein [Candidatus Stahlbacteria bacterium]
MLKAILDFILPPHCSVCSNLLASKEKAVCENCFNSISVIVPPFCERCGSPGDAVCNDCILHPHKFTRARAIGKYTDILRDLVLLFKYRRKISIGRKLGTLLGKIIQNDELLAKADAIIPVPLYPVAKRVRGYNQSEILCTEISTLTNIPTITGVLLQKRPTKPQKSIGSPESSLDEQREKRKLNVKDAFKVKKNERVKGKKLILVDDVCTTGATLDECAGELYNAGASDVYAAVVARAV